MTYGTEHSTYTSRESGCGYSFVQKNIYGIGGF